MIDHVGVVIPAGDEGELIARCLDSVVLAAAATDARVTIVVVADGCADGIALESGCSWLACTDADSVVPANWIAEQLRLAAAGHDVVIGTVRPDFADLSPAHVQQWHETHLPGQPNGHVHGANLGVRSSTYLEVGGFHPLDEHEDNELVVPLMAINARTQGRTAGGYAGHLREIAEALERESRSVTG